MKAKTFETQFDEGASVMPFADKTQTARPNKLRRVNVDFPEWMVEALDTEAHRLGVSRQALVKVWIANCLAQESQGVR
jgi:hypothetical protein